MNQAETQCVSLVREDLCWCYTYTPAIDAAKYSGSLTGLKPATNRNTTCLKDKMPVSVESLATVIAKWQDPPNKKYAWVAKNFVLVLFY